MIARLRLSFLEPPNSEVPSYNEDVSAYNEDVSVKVPVITSPVKWSGVNFPRSVSVFRGKSEASRETITVGTRIKNLMVLVVPHRMCV